MVTVDVASHTTRPEQSKCTCLLCVIGAIGVIFAMSVVISSHVDFEDDGIGERVYGDVSAWTQVTVMGRSKKALSMREIRQESLVKTQLVR